jgi:recombination protein RecT
MKMAGPRTDDSGRIQKTAQNGAGAAIARKTLAQQLNDPAMLQELRRALPTHIKPEKMSRIVLTALRTTRELDKTTPESFFGCVMQAAQLGLDVNTPNGHAYLIPRRNNKAGTMECTLIVGYQGMIELALRSGKVEKIWTRVVREGDHFRVKYGLEEDIEHEPAIDADRETRPISYVYAVAALTTGGKVFEVLSTAQVNERRKRSAASSSGPWQTDYEAMVRKTAVRSLFKWVPKSSELALAESLEERLEEGRSQAFDGMVNDSVERLGMRPIDTEGESVTSGNDGEESRVTYDADGVVTEPGASDPS